MSSWFTKHRPTKISQLHLTTVRDTLRGFLTSPQFPQALLFAGPKGTGKTSSSRIIAALLNDPANSAMVEFLFFNGKKPKKLQLQEPDENNDLVKRIQQGSSLVVNEMDAASNRGIDDIRALKERIALPPQEGKVAVYILDEAHMLTTEAFNALLKVLEEPPNHVVFILATTELHKIPETIISRCFQVQFQKASPEEIEQALVSVAQKEKLKDVPKEIFSLIATQADGSFRDAVKIFEHLVTSGVELKPEDVEQYLTAGSSSYIQALVAAVLEKDQAEIVTICNGLRAQGANQTVFLKALLSYLHQQLSFALGVAQGEAFASAKIIHFLLKELSQIDIQQNSPISFLNLELKLLELVFRSQARKGGTGSGTVTASSLVEKKQTISKPILKSAGQIEAVVKSDFAPSSQVEAPSEVDAVVELGNGQQIIDRWEEFLAQVKEKNSTIQALLRTAQPMTGETGRAKIAVFYQFHQEQLQQPKFLNLLEMCGQELAGGRVELDFVLSDQPTSQSKPSSETNQPLVDLAESILV